MKVMTLHEYLNQDYPEKNPKVELNESEVELGEKKEFTDGTGYDITIIQPAYIHKFGKDGKTPFVYKLIEDRLFVCDHNEQPMAPSVFWINEELSNKIRESE